VEPRKMRCDRWSPVKSNIQRTNAETYWMFEKAQNVLASNVPI